MCLSEPTSTKRRSNRVGIYGDRIIIRPFTLNALSIRSYNHTKSIALAVCIFAIELCVRLAIFGPMQNTLSRCESVFARSGPCHGFIRLGFGIPDLAWLISRSNPTRCGGFVRLSYSSKRNKCDRGGGPRCTGLGSQLEIDPELVVPDPELSIGQGALAPWAGSSSGYYDQMTTGLAARYDVDLDAPWRTLGEEQRQVFLYGTRSEERRVGKEWRAP